MRVLGVDPGLQGALASWDGKQLIVVDVPIMKARKRGNEVNLPAFADLVRKLAPFGAAYVERNSSRPREGVSSARKGGLVEGIILGCVIVYTKNIIRVPPNQWKRIMRVTKDKEYSCTKAIEEFPDYHYFFAKKKDHGRAEAALLALYGYRKYRANEPRKRLRRRL
jgi:crossover junction endodeoxyribonuclease RuvC